MTAQHGKHIKYRPYAFTEHGAIMAANVLSSPDAIKASVFVVRAFVKLRELLSTHVQLAHKLEELEAQTSPSTMIASPWFLMPFASSWRSPKIPPSHRSAFTPN